MRTPTATILILATLSLGSTAVEAQQGWVLRLSPTVFDTNARFVETFADTGNTNEASVDGAVGLGASLERALGKHWGLEAGLLAVRLPTTLEVRTVGGSILSDEDDLRVVSPFLMLNWFPRREARFAPFLGLGVAQTRFGDLSLLGQNVDGGDDFGLLAQAGAEIRLKGRLRLFASVIFLDTTYEGERSNQLAAVELDIDLSALRVGVSMPLG